MYQICPRAPGVPARIASSSPLPSGSHTGGPSAEPGPGVYKLRELPSATETTFNTGCWPFATSHNVTAIVFPSGDHAGAAIYPALTTDRKLASWRSPLPSEEAISRAQMLCSGAPRKYAICFPSGEKVAPVSTSRANWVAEPPSEAILYR